MDAHSPAYLRRHGHLDHRGHRVWWGETDGSLRAAPLLTVHGGPGLTHDYLEPLAALSPSRRVAFYDQFGSGRSERAADPSEYGIDLFVEELAAVRDALGYDEVHLFAHSYGGPLAIEYLLAHPDSGVLSLTLSNTFGSIAALSSGWQKRIGELDQTSAAALHGDPGAHAYGPALGEFVTRFVLPHELPDCLVRSQQQMGAEVYAAMHGSSWFTPDGAWRDWDATGRLAEIAVPALVIGGTRDQCVPELAEQLASGLPHAELVILDSAHLPFVELPDEYLEVLGRFLDRHDTAVVG